MLFGNIFVGYSFISGVPLPPVRLNYTLTTKKTIHEVDSMILSEYILQRGGAMSHLKLQKILFYVQALHLAYFDEAIIKDDFEAWLHGPVSRVVFDKIKDLSVLHSEIMFAPEQWPNETPQQILERTITSDQLDLVDEVIDSFGKLTSSQLENLTHSESPWIDAREGYGVGDKCEVVIPKEAMRIYYKQSIYGEGAES